MIDDNNHILKKKSFIDSIIDGFFEIFYSKNKTKLYLLIFMVVTLILRLLAANNTGLHPDDAVHAIRPIGVMESHKLVDYGQSSIFWYYLQENFYNIFGTSMLASRLACALFGAFSVLIVFMFVNYIFKSKKIGLISAFLVALSPFFIKMTLPEMDITANFFILISGFFLLKFLDNLNRKKILALSAVFIGIAVLIKVYSLFFALSYFLILIYGLKKSKDKGFKKKIFIFLAIVFLFCIPTLTHNYLLYKDRGFMDLMFTNFFKIGLEKASQVYPQHSGWMPKVDFKGFFLGNQWNYQGNTDWIYKLPGFIVMLWFLIKEDPLIIIFGIIGISLLLFKKEKKYPYFFIVNVLLPFIFLATYIPMVKHQAFMFLFFVPASAYAINELHDKIIRKIPRFRLRFLILIFLVINLALAASPYGIKHTVFAQSGDSQLISYRIKNINDNSLVVVDGRIYRGSIAWMFNDKYYIEGSLFSKAVEISLSYDNSTIPIETYFIECAKDDCGWGTIKDQPDFNQSMEQMATWFGSNGQFLKEIKEINTENFYFPIISKKEYVPAYKVYKTTLYLSPAIMQLAKSTHDVITYPLGYDEKIEPILDKYDVHNSFDSFLNNFAYFILRASVFLVLISLLYVLYLFFKKDENNNNNSCL